MSTATAIEKAGVVGAGGSGFPTHVKAAGRADTMIANGAECEPLLRSDEAMMKAAPERVLRGLALMRDSLGASRAVIALKRENVEAGDALTATLDRFPGVELELLDDVYPAGDEYLLVYELTGRVIPEGGIPLDIGVVVNNVTTLANVASAVEGRPVTRRLISVQGAVKSPATFEVPIGVSIGELVAAAGGATVENPAVIVGGPMMGRLADQLSEPVTKTVGGIIVLPSEHPLITSRVSTEAHVLRVARAACCQCMACTELCPRALLGHELAPHRTVRAIQYSTLEIDHPHITSAYLCCECGMCELFACPLGIQPRRILADLKAELSRRGIKNPHTRTQLGPDDVREYRQIPSKRLVQRLGLSDYDGQAPVEDWTSEVRQVVLLMSQHVGKPACPAVEVGQRVLEGDVVGEIQPGCMGARVHASIAGKVTSVTPAEIIIESESRQGR